MYRPYSIFSGAATTASRLGMPDLAIATLNDFVQSAQMICSLSPTTPVIADADTGFGGATMVARTVQQYAKAGVAALHIEDQVDSKRCGHLQGKEVVSREEFVARIRAAVVARDQIPGGSDFVSFHCSNIDYWTNKHVRLSWAELIARKSLDLMRRYSGNLIPFQSIIRSLIIVE